MNKVILQIWEESNSKKGFVKDGCSMHIDINERNQYVNFIYSGRDKSNIPETYDRIVGDEVDVFVTDNIYNSIKKRKTIKISESSFNNLRKFQDIIFDISTT